MAMSVGGGDATEKPMSDINTTPLVDVMLVLLIIFLIAVPAVVQSVKLALPKEKYEPTTTKPENLSLSVRGVGDQCEVYWGMTRIGSGELRTKAEAKLKAEIERQGGIGNNLDESVIVGRTTRCRSVAIVGSGVTSGISIGDVGNGVNIEVPAVRPGRTQRPRRGGVVCALDARLRTVHLAAGSDGAGVHEGLQFVLHDEHAP